MELIIKLSLPLFCILFLTACSGGARIGMKNGKLSPCPKSPNCVVSQDADEKHQVDPISYNTTRAEAYERIKNILLSRKGAAIIKETQDYIHAEFKSRIMRFVDDVEFYFPENESVIHVRSASRVGYSDLGVNRKRVETIRSLFQSASK